MSMRIGSFFGMRMYQGLPQVMPQCMPDPGKSKSRLAGNNERYLRSVARHAGYSQGCRHRGCSLSHPSQSESKQISTLNKPGPIVCDRKSNPVIVVEERNPQMGWVCVADCVCDGFLPNAQQRGGYGRAQWTLGSCDR